MNADSSYLTERLAERRRRVCYGVAGIALLMALGLGLLLSHPMPAADTMGAPAAGERVAGSTAERSGVSALR